MNDGTPLWLSAQDAVFYEDLVIDNAPKTIQERLFVNNTSAGIQINKLSPSGVPSEKMNVIFTPDITNPVPTNNVVEFNIGNVAPILRMTQSNISMTKPVTIQDTFSTNPFTISNSTSATEMTFSNTSLSLTRILGQNVVGVRDTLIVSNSANTYSNVIGPFFNQLTSVPNNYAVCNSINLCNGIQTFYTGDATGPFIPAMDILRTGIVQFDYGINIINPALYSNQAQLTVTDDPQAPGFGLLNVGIQGGTGFTTGLFETTARNRLQVTGTTIAGTFDRLGNNEFVMCSSSFVNPTGISNRMVINNVSNIMNYAVGNSGSDTVYMSVDSNGNVTLPTQKVSPSSPTFSNLGLFNYMPLAFPSDNSTGVFRECIFGYTGSNFVDKLNILGSALSIYLAPYVQLNLYSGSNGTGTQVSLSNPNPYWYFDTITGATTTFLSYNLTFL